MKLIRHFDNFLANHVNLSSARLSLLDQRTGAVEGFLSNGDDEISKRFVQMIPQGSYAYRTIINPVGKYDEFDADLLLELQQEPDWEAEDYIEELYKVFRANATYRDMVSRHARCVKVDYANEFHIDVVPYIERHREHFITNRDDNDYERTNPEGFNEWFAQQNSITGGRMVKVIRLLKYLRDYKNTFSVKSVILTILVGGRVNNALLVNDPSYYKDLPTALKNILSDLNDYLQENPLLPELVDPSCPTESFNHRCSQEEYTNLRNRIKYYSGKATDAYNDPDPDSSMKKWQDIFGDKFGRAENATKATNAHTGRAKDTEQFIERDLGIPMRINQNYELSIGATALPAGRKKSYNLRTHGNVVGVDRKVRFTVAKCDVPPPFSIYWKVRNTGEEAIEDDCIRGQIVPDDGQGRREEPTKYKGKHYVKCYIVKNNICVAEAHQDVIIR